ncbi:MAG TPA: hypothetical protein VGQ22_24565 [Steroidobacteraceae bacterium]|nr:hypothetical protein [Steroidobacteraceae bacterium]
MAAEPKDGWDKAAIILQPVGGLLTALSVALLGILGSKFLGDRQTKETNDLDRRQATETNVRLYTDLMSKREEADSTLRRDMFESIVKAFLEPKSSGPEQKVLSLELMAYNFHESIDLSPLFRHVYKEIDPRMPDGKQYLGRLEKVATEVSSKQVAALEEMGGKLDGVVVFDDIEKNLEKHVPVIEGTLTMHAQDAKDLPIALRKRYFRLDALYADPNKKELRVQLKVNTPGAIGGERPEDVDDVYTTFWIGFFDFPVIDNTRLGHGQRCAIAFKSFSPDRAQITLVYFPGSRAGLKEKPYYDEIIDSLTRKAVPESK